MEYIATHETYLYGQEKLPMLLISLTLFLAFTRWKMNYRKWINITASATFGVYLIHDNKIVRSFFVDELIQKLQVSGFYYDHSLFYWSSCYSLYYMYNDWFSKKESIEKRYMRIIDKYSVSWLKIFREIYNFLKGKFLVKRKAVEVKEKWNTII